MKTSQTTSHPSVSFSFEAFNAACKAALPRVLAELPESPKLSLSRRAQRHGTDSRFLQFFIWIKGQPGTLHKNHFNCSVIYDPACRYHSEWKDRGLPHNLFCRFYANKRRIYNQEDAIRTYLARHLREVEAKLPGWYYDEHTQMMSLMHPFAAASVAALEERIYTAFKVFLPLWIPHYAFVCSLYSSGLDPATISARIRERGPSPFVPKRSPEDLSAYARIIPARLRQQVLRRDNNRCRRCGSTHQLHIDHIKPVSHGGLTKVDNLQALCAVCNLSKGNREQIRY